VSNADKDMTISLMALADTFSLVFFIVDKTEQALSIVSVHAVLTAGKLPKQCRQVLRVQSV